MRRFASLLLALLGPAAFACSGSDEAIGTDDRGADVCESYRDALCDWVVRCNPDLEYADCHATASAIVCAADGRAEVCSAAIDLADCQQPPDDCELFDVADREPARQACEQYKSSLCASRAACDTQSLSECEQELAALDCAGIVGVKAGFEDCISGLETGACEPSPPAICRDILLAEPQLP